MPARQSAAAIAALCGILIAACSTNRGGPLEVTDTSALPSLRVAITPAGVEAPSRPTSGFGLELGVSEAKGSSTQTLGAADTAVLDGRTIAGPAQLTNDAEVRFVDALVRWRALSSQGPLGLELLAGLTHGNYDFKAGGVSSSRGSAMLTLGVGGLYRVGPDTTVHLRYSGSAGGSTGSLTAQRAEISLVQSLGRNFAARLGYGLWNVVSTPPEPDSELRTRLSGPVLGIDLSF